jgi:hypothetical protein
MSKCAFMNRECTTECVAHVPTNGPDMREGYHFTFPCVRLDAQYDQAAAIFHILEVIRNGMLQ